MIVFGWPSVIIGLTVQFPGILRRSARLAFFGALLSLGFCFYIMLSPPPFRWFGFLAASGNFVSAVAVVKRRPLLAATALLPFAMLAAGVALEVLTQ